jgi:hypothetical protein
MRAWKQIKLRFSGYFGKRLCHAGSHQIENRNVLKPIRVTESELVNVRLQILRADGMVSSVNRPLQLRPEPVDCVGMCMAANVFALPVVDLLMPESKRRNIVSLMAQHPTLSR